MKNRLKCIDSLSHDGTIKVSKHTIGRNVTTRRYIVFVYNINVVWWRLSATHNHMNRPWLYRWHRLAFLRVMTVFEKLKLTFIFVKSLKKGGPTFPLLAGPPSWKVICRFSFTRYTTVTFLRNNSAFQITLCIPHCVV